MKRSSGILMHITSAALALRHQAQWQAAYDFIDFLRAAKQTYWQILPINPPRYGDSPIRRSLPSPGTRI